MAWTRKEGPLTRGKHRESRATTRTMRQLDLHRKLKFMCGCCADFENPAIRVNNSTLGKPKSNLCFKKRCNKDCENIDDPRKHVAHKIHRVYTRRSCKARVARGKLRNGRGSVKRDVSAPKPTQERPSAAAACAVSSTCFGECNHLLPFAFANSNRSVKRVAAFGCHTCDCAYSEQTPTKCNTVDRLQQESKVILWGDSYLKVRLCDILPICVECEHKCSFVLTDDVKSKYCFKKEMRAGFRFEPGCLSRKKQSFHEIVQARNNGRLSRSDVETNPSQLTNGNDQNKDVTNTDSGALANHVLQNQKSGRLAGSAEQSPNKVCMSDVQSKCTDSCRNILENDSLLSIRPGILSEVYDIQNGGCMDSPLSNNGFSDTLGFVHCVDSPKKTEEQPLKPNGLTLDKTDELDSFTCQRVKVYSGKNISSCARTYLTWPLLSRKICSTVQTENGDCFTGHLSSCQIRQPFEPVDPNQAPQPKLSISDQMLGASKNENTSDNVGASSDLSQNNKKCPRYSSQQNATVPKKLGTFCKGLATSSSQRPASVQINESTTLMDSSRSTPSPSTLGLTETCPNVFATAFPETPGILSAGVVRGGDDFETLFNTCSVNLQQTKGLDFNDSCDSSSLLPQYMEVSQGENVAGRSPPKLEPFFKSSPFTCKLNTAYGNESLLSEKYIDTNRLLPPLLSPLSSPLKHIVASTSVEYDNHYSDIPKPKTPSENHTPEITNVNENRHAQYCGSPQMEAFPSRNDVHKFVVPEEENHHQPLFTYSIEQSPASDASAQSSLSPHKNKKSNDESYSDQDSNCSEMSEPEEDLVKPGVLDELDAYEQDILLVDLFQDDSELFEKLPQKGVLKLGPVRIGDTPELRPKKVVKIKPPVSESPKIPQSFTTANLDFLHDSPEDSPRRSWRPQCNSTFSAPQYGSNKQYKMMGSSEGKLVNTRTVHFPTENVSPHISPLLASRIGFTTRTTNTLNAADIRCQKPVYCRNYFSEVSNCVFKTCRFHHVPMDGDEKFCTETVARFAKNPACLHKAGAVFNGFYQSNKPGAYFSLPVLVTLLWALLKAGMLSDLFSVLRTTLAHNIMPEHEFLLDLFNIIRQKSLLSFVPELMQLTFKMAGAGLPLSLDCLDLMKNTELHQTVSSNSAAPLSGNNNVTRSTSTSEYLSLAHAVVEMELCTKQEDWKRLGKVFQSICQSSQQASQVERISGRIAVALLSESKDRLTLPFAAFAETAAHNVDENCPVKSCLGRIGVSLMLRYHKTHQWAKGLKVVEVLSAAKVSYATMKGLFGNEDSTSRCHLINVATELFLLNNIVEGALNTLRENEWFLTSSMWPCEAPDIENRTHVLLCLAEKTSHRDTLEILSNLPGLKEPNGHIDISRYTTFFTAHLQVCLDRQIVPLASDLVDFMLSKGLQVDHALLQMLLHKLGKQNLWLRAREIFKHSVNKGYYPGVAAPLGLMTLMVPPQLGEIELALTFEKFMTVNVSAILSLPENTTCTMSITLKRTQNDESDYLSAGSRLLSAACIPQPKLGVRYMAVNSSQEQVFALDISSARRWLRHNHLWANEVWTSST